MKNSFQLIGSLTVICLISGALLAFVHSATSEKIAEVAQARTDAAASDVLPPHASVLEPIDIVYENQTYRFRPANTEDGSLAGFAIEMRSQAGYGGEIRMMLGIDAKGHTTGLAILPGHKETPGLGAKITEPAFQNAFTNKPLLETKWAVVKDGGVIDEITAATISSRAVTEAVASAAKAFSANQDKLIHQE
jgi:electron transport complex protein RnfG